MNTLPKASLFPQHLRGRALRRLFRRVKEPTSSLPSSQAKTQVNSAIHDVATPMVKSHSTSTPLWHQLLENVMFKLVNMSGVHPNSVRASNWVAASARRAKGRKTINYHEAVSQPEQCKKKSAFYKGPTHGDSTVKYSTDGIVIDYALSIYSVDTSDNVLISHRDAACCRYLLNSTDVLLYPTTTVSSQASQNLPTTAPSYVFGSLNLRQKVSKGNLDGVIRRTLPSFAMTSLYTARCKMCSTTCEIKSSKTNRSSKPKCGAGSGMTAAVERERGGHQVYQASSSLLWEDLIPTGISGTTESNV
ncbi:hypothetical protein CFAM422_009638 [Trichoderma lentiforme]|uniref:Uncharacterized protein n=1 Tax=Trichoderma lentiforme TaxID=1567552 RepID=A0A9P5C8T4_9HYPO|nr:hypothetical protein CFAM422_009638 [Trichoderma lentiforme]